MSLIFVDIDAKCDLPVCASDTVYLCLNDAWAAKTQSGLAFAIGMVTTVNQVVDSSTTTICCSDVVVSTVMCRYQVQVDDSQFKQDPATLAPYLLTSADVNEIFPYTCTLAKALEEIHLDGPNVINTADDVANTNTLDFPIIRIDADGAVTAHSSGQIVLPGGDFTVVDSLMTYTSSAGKSIPLELCDIIETCFDGVTITRTGPGATYVAAAAVVHTFTAGGPASSGTITETYTGDGTVIYQGPSTLTHNNTCGSPGPSGWLAGGITITGLDWEVFRVPEHGTLSQTVVFTDSVYNAIGGGGAEVGLLINGNSNTKTDAYREVTFNNPSSCRPMAYLVFADSSFAGEQTAGAVIWGSSLWIDGVKIANQNGRTLGGFNVSWSVSSLLQDHAMPAHHYAGVIPAGGSVIVGLDFGDSDVFANVGTPGVLNVESRVISIIGSTT